MEQNVKSRILRICFLTCHPVQLQTSQCT